MSKKNKFYSAFEVVFTRSLIDAIHYLKFELENLNHNLTVNLDLSELHVTLLYCDVSVLFPLRETLKSQITNLVPSSLSLETSSLDLFGDAKDVLVVKINSPLLESVNKKLVTLTRSLGISTSEFDYIPHMTIGTVSKSTIQLPSIKSTPIYLSSLIYKSLSEVFNG